MWPMLLNMTRDECRRTLRRLELEAYSNMISVFRAQGALEDNRKKLLEELRAVLHISNDRHSAEARRVSNDELLATIAEQLAGPNTGLAWICEGRRRVPLMPRGVAQTMYTEIADKAAEAAAAENKEIRKRIETEKLIAPKSNEEETLDHEGETAESALQSNEVPDDLYPPIAMEDHSAKIWETELICRKRKLPEGGVVPEEVSTPIKNMRNVSLNTNQKHLNLSQAYSRFSQPSASKSSGHSKHSYNQVSKVSTSKSSQPLARSTPHKPRAHRQTKAQAKAQKKTQEIPVSPTKQYNQSLQMELTGPPGSFQASYAQSILGGKTKVDYLDEMNSKTLSPSRESSAAVTKELAASTVCAPSSAPVDHGVRSRPAPAPDQLKQTQIVSKKRSDGAIDKKVQMSEQKPPEEVKFIPMMGRQMVSASSATSKPLGAGRLVTTKVISSMPKTLTAAPIIHADKMIVVSKSSIENRIPNSKIIITSSAIATPNRESLHSSTNSLPNKTSETLTPKGIPATDLKVSAKTFVLNPKSGQKMVVLPAKSNKDVQLPMFHFKGIPSAMKLVSVSSQINAATTKTPAITVMSKPTVVSTLPSNAKIVGVEPIKTANMADIVPVKGIISPNISTKITNPIVRPANTKGNIIVVQKGATLGKALTFTKNGNDVSKIIMGKNVNKLLQTSKSDQVDPTKGGNVIVLELNNEQTGRTTTMSEILGSRHTNTTIPIEEKNAVEQEITQDTPVLFENQITSDICNASSLDSTTSLQEMERLEVSTLSMIDKGEKEKSEFIKESDSGKDTRVTDWEIDIDTVSGKSKDEVEKLNSLHLDLGMSSDSENEFMVDGGKSKSQLPLDRIQNETPPGDGHEIYPPSALSRATRTLLSQLQDDGSSSNDSSFTIKTKIIGQKDVDVKIDKSESEALSKARAKLSEKVAEARSQQKRIDVYSTAISAEINLDSFSYLEEGLMAGDEERNDHLSRLLTDDQSVAESLPLDKNEQ